ncbi:MAG: glycosyltransferase family 61 protein [bacterium]
MSLPTSLAHEASPLRPETISRRKLPVNFNPEDIDLFQEELERVIPPTKLLTRYNVGVSPEGILFQRGKMLPESFAFPANLENWKRRSVLKFFLSNHILRKRRRFERESVWVIDDWSLGYFHWLADVLPRLMTIRERLPDLVLLLPHKYKELEFVQASLKSFAIGEVKYLDENEVLSCAKLIVPTQTAPSGHYNEKLIQEVRDLLVGFYASEPRETVERVYISRALAPKRRIKNEDEVIEVLREFNFRIIRPEDHSFAEQVRVASGARYLVSNHGAGLANMLFMTPEASVLELRYSGDRINNCYFTLASALDLKYHYQSCEPASSDETPHTADLQVDCRVLRANLELMLAS